MVDFNKQLRELKNDFEQSTLDNPTQIYSKCSKSKENKKRLFFESKNLFMKYVLAILLIVCICVSTLSIVLYNGNNKYSFIYSPGENTGKLPADDSIKQIANLEELKMLVTNSSTLSDTANGGNFDKTDGVVPEAGLDEDMSVIDSSPSYTTGSTDIEIDTDRIYSTNNQVEKVEEADVVKVNGDYIYYIPNPSQAVNSYYFYYNAPEDSFVYILKAKGDSVEVEHKLIYENTKNLITEEEEGKLYDCSISYPNELYCTDQFLIVSANTQKWVQIEIYNEGKLTRTLRRDSYTYTEYYIYDIHSYELITSIKTAGYNVSTRLVDNELYIINNYVDYQNNENGYIPRWYFGEYEISPSVDRFYYCQGIGVNITSYVVIYKITLGNEIKVDDFYFLTPSISNVYMQKDAIYMIRNYSINVEADEKTSTKWQSSKVVIINVENEIIPDGVIEVKGFINDKYWIDVNDGYLRVATTGRKYVSKIIGGKYIYSTTSEVFNYITIFKKNKDGLWKQISSITEGIGEPGETMRSARFNGDVVTVVTFRQTDPLYYIDISNPFSPKITSELKVSGYTVYQHPYKQNYVIGIGYEATSSGSTTGYKIALFDVSDKLNIKQVGNALVLSKKEYYSPNVLQNPKEIMLDLTNNMFGFSIIGYERTSDRNEYADGTTSYYKYTNNYFVFEVDENSDNPITIKLRESLLSTSANYVDNLRMVFIKDKYYLLSNLEVYVYNHKLEKINTKTLN